MAVDYVVSCPCGAKRLCRKGLTTRATPAGVLYPDTTLFVHGFKEPVSEEQHFWMLHEECPWNPSNPSSP
jgi:hypothetical protein